MLFRKLRPYLFSSSELYRFLALAIPVLISNGTEAILLFVDRLFLSRYAEDQGEVYINAGLVGGLTVFVLTAFFSVTAGYTNALVSQYLGAKQKQLCARVVSQTVFFALAVFPLILWIGTFLGDVFSWFGHPPKQIELETTYAQILLWGSLIVILRSSLGGFFIGIGKANVVMIANVVGMLSNIPLNYVLIFGWGPIPPLGIVGAALGSIFGSLIAFLIQVGVYYGPRIHQEFRTRRKFIFDPSMTGKLLKYGIPSGLETVSAVLVFDFFILAMNSYGKVIGSAVTIAINWDAMVFIPMVGAGFATTALAGRHMGAGNIFEVKRTAFLACTVSFTYAALMGFFMLIFADSLTEIFLSKMQNPESVKPVAVFMIRLAALYLVGDAIHLSLAGVLRGAGDTSAIMIISLILHGIFGFGVYWAIFRENAPPLTSWFLLLGFVFLMAIAMFLRFLQGKWQNIRMVENA